MRTMISFITGSSWAEIMEQNRSLVIAGRNILCKRLKINPPCPDEMVTSMATLVLPDIPRDTLRAVHKPDALHAVLRDKYKIQVRILHGKEMFLLPVYTTTKLYAEKLHCGLYYSMITMCAIVRSRETEKIGAFGRHLLYFWRTMISLFIAVIVWRNFFIFSTTFTHHNSIVTWVADFAKSKTAQ